MPEVPRLHTERLLLRAWRPWDLEPFAAMNADSAYAEHLPGTLSRLESDALAARMAGHLDEHGFGRWAVEAPGVAPFIGFVGLLAPTFPAHFTPCVEVGWGLAPAFWGHGYATEAARAAVRIGFEQLGFEEIVSFTAPANRRSIRVMERLGMVRDVDGDFDHPRLPEGHPLRRHVLCRLRQGG